MNGPGSIERTSRNPQGPLRLLENVLCVGADPDNLVV